MRAWLNLRLSLPARVAAFTAGLQALGYRVEMGLPGRPAVGDVLVTWNRIREGDACARRFEEAGLPVLVAENAAWGNEFAGGGWLSLARNYHNTAGRFPIGGPERWDALGVELAPWRTGGKEVVVLPQRGIGSPPVAMPRDWLERARRDGRVRLHPGQRECVPLAQDLANARQVVTWGSGAAIKALMLGIPVRSDMPGWIGEQDNTDAGRLAMFRRLAWAQWRREEIADGTAFGRLLGGGSLRAEVRAAETRPDPRRGLARVRRQA